MQFSKFNAQDYSTNRREASWLFAECPLNARQLFPELTDKTDSVGDGQLSLQMPSSLVRTS